MRTVDLRGRRSPYPIIQIAKTMKRVSPGETVNFLINDKDSVDEVYDWIRRTGHLLKAVVKRRDHWLVQIAKRE